MSANNLQWNKTIPSYELPLVIQTNLCEEELEYINTHYDFLLSESPTFQIFYSEYNPKYDIHNINYANYSVVSYEAYSLNELLKGSIFNENFLKSKKMYAVHAIKKHTNYYSIRYAEVLLNHLIGNLIRDKTFFNSLIRKEKIKLLFENDNNKMSFKNFVSEAKSINPDNILSKEIKGFNI